MQKLSFTILWLCHNMSVSANFRLQSVFPKMLHLAEKERESSDYNYLITAFPDLCDSLLPDGKFLSFSICCLL